MKASRIIRTEVFISGKSRRVHPFLFLSKFICINNSFLRSCIVEMNEANILYVFSTQNIYMYVYLNYNGMKLDKSFSGGRQKRRDSIVFPKRRTRVSSSQSARRKKTKRILSCTRFLLFNAKQVIHVPAVAFVPRHARRDIFNNNSFRPFADTPLKNLETTQEGRDGEGDAKMRYKVRRTAFFLPHIYRSSI